jgi:cytochrome P450
MEAVPKTSATLAYALYHLTKATPDVIHSMREEVGTALRLEGWTLSALDRMRLVDSFLKESMRLNGIRTGNALCDI